MNARRPNDPSTGGPSAPGGSGRSHGRAKTPRERLRISGISVVAGAAAAATASAATSVLGVAGTVAGAAVVSAVITVAAAVYDHSLRQAKVRLAERMEVTARLPRLLADGSVAPDGAAPDGGSGTPSTPDGPGGRGGTTRQTPFVSPLEATAEGVDGGTGGLAPPSDAATTAELPIAYVAAAPGQSLPLDPLDLEDERGYHWGRIAAVSLLVFALAMVVVTGFELVTGRPLSSLFTDTPAQGTTVGRIVRPHRDATSPAPSPSPTTPTPTSPSPTPTSPSPTPTSPSPTPSPTTRTPTPTTTPTPSPTGSTAGGGVSPTTSPTATPTR